jgi:hypothetical protein
MVDEQCPLQYGWQWLQSEQGWAHLRLCCPQGSISHAEFKKALRLKTMLVFDDALLRQVRFTAKE